MPKTQSQIDTGQIITPRIGWLFRQTVPLPNFTWLLRKPLQIPKPFIVVLLPIATLCPPLAMPKKVCHPWQTTRLTQPPSPPPPLCLTLKRVELIELRGPSSTFLVHRCMLMSNLSLWWAWMDLCNRTLTRSSCIRSGTTSSMIWLSKWILMLGFPLDYRSLEHVD
jgi:hypothetical protein